MSPASDTQRNWRIHLFSGYAQDEMRLHRRLTLTLGVRYDAHSTPRERDGKVATLPDPLHDTTSTVGGDVFRNPSLKNFAPRASLAWDVTGGGKTIIRMGWGMFYDLIGSRELLITGNRMPPFYRRTVFANPSIFPDLLAAAASTRGADSFDVLSYHLDQPYILKHRFAVEQRLTPASLLRITYAGSRGGAHLSGILGETNPHVPQFLPDDGYTLRRMHPSAIRRWDVSAAGSQGITRSIRGFPPNFNTRHGGRCDCRRCTRSLSRLTMSRR